MEDKDLYAEIASIRSIMERSTKFISLSGLSGVMAGIYALIGAGLAYKLIYTGEPQVVYVRYNDPLVVQLFLIACAVLVCSIGTGVWLTVRKAAKKGESVWNQSSQMLLKNGALPLLTGGCFVLLLLCRGYYGVISPGCLIFYGLALVAASRYTYGDVKWLGLCDIGLGLLATLLPGYGLLFWALGFGVLHILYGTIMHFKYDR
ncbi:hypothetical protein [Mucilaginibacter segetis]|uniref:Uncharacterized protein n=1 Tax=Mucilaginibacter segetis TaxID=2793071 RepID=A0A934PTT5_9SPHI|nr:hypothetical protein [Mucilaginibacter segetis]MBK0380703.1 hypothetical protein [Mucilaginibacter segetis]